MWVRELEWIEPMAAAYALRGLASVAFLDSAMAHPTLGRFSYLAADPFGIFTVRGAQAFWNGAIDNGTPIVALRRRLAACAVAREPDLPPFQGGAIGYFGYDFGWSLEGRAAPHGASGDDVHFAFYDIVLAFDHVERTCRLIASGLPETLPAARRRHAESRLDLFAARLMRGAPMPAAQSVAAEWHADNSREAYRSRIERLKAYIRDGDIYQANIAQRFVALRPRDVAAFDLYRVVRAGNPAPFAAYLDCGDRQVISTSPELFLRCDGARVETRPIKGTARRHDDPAADSAAAARLLSSRKDRAENVMIVDLLRNDLARVCRPTSVEAPVVCGLESYAGLHHLVSSVTGDLAPGRDALDLVAAAFPGGSITGAPKIRAMEIIAEIEKIPRGVYCGAIGWLGFDGALDLNIAIRTIVVEGGRLDLRAGGGITILSDADAEYEETFVKARRILEAFATEPAEIDA